MFYNNRMNIYVDFRKLKNNDELTQAVKVFALTNKNIIIKVLIDQNSNHTFEDDSNLKIVSNIDDENFLLLATNNECNNSDLAFTILKTMSNKKIIFGDLSLNSKLALNEKIDLLKKKIKGKSDATYCLMSIPNLNCNEINDFDNVHKGDNLYLGIIEPKEIYDVLPDICLTTPLVSNIFISSLNATLKFVNTKNEAKDNSGSFFLKMFSNLGRFNDTNSKDEKINYLLEEYTIYLKKNNVTVVAKADGNYAFYFAILNSLRDNFIN